MTDTPAVEHILAVDDHPIVRAGIVHCLQPRFPDAVFYEAGSVKEAKEQLQQYPVEVALIDISLPDATGYDLCAYIVSNYPHIINIGFSVYTDVFRIAKMLKAGANAFISKEAAITKLGEALYHIRNNKRYLYISENEKKVLDAQHTNLFIAEHGIEGRMLDLARLICNGHITDVMAKQLNVAPKTVENERIALYKKAGVTNLASFVRLMVEEGVV